nr:PAS domain S-box protein [Chitinophagaceae bacterium]
MTSGNILIGALAEIAVKFNNFSAQDIDLDYITDKAREISGARYAVLNHFDKRKLTATTLAYAGLSGHLKKASSLLGFEFVGKSWDVEPELLSKMTDNPILVHDHLFELAKTNLPETFIKLLVNIFNLGKVATVATNCDEEILGNFHLLFVGEDEIKSKELLRLYASMTGNLLKRIESERKLLQEYQKMEVITTNSPNLLLMVDQKLNVTYINRVLPGFDWEKLIGKDLLNYLFQQHLQEYPGWLKEVFSTRMTIEKEVNVVGQFGEEAIYQVTLLPLTQQGKASSVFIMAADVTKSRQTEARLKLIAGTINEGFYLYNITERKYEFVSPNCTEILGVTEQFFYEGNNFNDQFVYEADKERLFWAYKDIIAGIPYDIEYRIWVKQAIRWINEKSFPIKDDKGNTVKHTGLFADVTERKTIELQLQQNFAFQKTIAEISEQLVQTSTETLNHTINDMLRKLGHHFRVDRSYLFLYAQDGATMSNTHEWCNAGIEPQKESVQNYPVDPDNWWKRELDAGRYLHIPNVDALGDDTNPEKAIFQAQGIQSLLFLPVRTHSKVWGFIGLDAVKSRYSWSENEIENLQIAANTLASLLQKLESRKQLSDVIHAVDESSLVSMTDSCGTIVKVNKLFCEISGYCEAELLGQNHRIINSGYHDKRFWSEFWETITAGKIWKGEVKNRAKDGSTYWVLTVVNPIINYEGKITHYLSIRQDITDRKNVETELLQSRERWQLAIDGTNDGMWDWDIQTGAVYYSPRWEEMFGFKTGEVPQQVDAMNTLVHP